VIIIKLIFEIKTIMNIVESACAADVIEKQRRQKRQKVILIVITIISSVVSECISNFKIIWPKTFDEYS